MTIISEKGGVWCELWNRYRAPKGAKKRIGVGKKAASMEAMEKF